MYLIRGTAPVIKYFQPEKSTFAENGVGYALRLYIVKGSEKCENIVSRRR